MWVRYFRGSNILRCMFSISIPSMLLEDRETHWFSLRETQYSRYWFVNCTIWGERKEKWEILHQPRYVFSHLFIQTFTHLNIEGELIRTGLSHFNPNARINVGNVCLQTTDTLKLYISLGCNFQFHLVVKRCSCYGSWGLFKISAGGLKTFKCCDFLIRNKIPGDPHYKLQSQFKSCRYCRNTPVKCTNVDPSVVSNWLQNWTSSKAYLQWLQFMELVKVVNSELHYRIIWYIPTR